MNYDMTRPCNDCPFRKEGGIPLTKGRIREIGGMMLSSQGGTFSCHKTVEYREGDDDQNEHFPRSGEQHCAGALLFMERHNPGGTQMARIMERLRAYDRRKLDQAAFPLVWDSLSQWLKAALPSGRKGRVKA